jgi:hypothetical protein
MPALITRNRASQTTEAPLPLTALFASIERIGDTRGAVHASDIRGIARARRRSENEIWQPIRSSARVRLAR